MRAVTSDIAQRQPDRQLRAGARSIRLAQQLCERRVGGRRLSRAVVPAYSATRKTHVAARCRRRSRAQRRARALDGIAFRAVHRRPWPCGARRPGELPVLERLRRRRAVVAGASRLRAERAHDDRARDGRSPDAELPALSTAALIEPERAPSASRRSPRRRWSRRATRPPSRATMLPATSAGRLPAKIEQVADAGPETVKLAAASNVESDVPPTLPVIEVATPPDGRRRAPATRARAGRQERARAKKRTPRAPTARRNEPCAPRPRSARRAAPRSPKWAQQMFVTPWQTQAFSYTQ